MAERTFNDNIRLIIMMLQGNDKVPQDISNIKYITYGKVITATTWLKLGPATAYNKIESSVIRKVTRTKRNSQYKQYLRAIPKIITIEDSTEGLKANVPNLDRYLQEKQFIEKNHIALRKKDGSFTWLKDVDLIINPRERVLKNTSALYYNTLNNFDIEIYVPTHVEKHKLKSHVENSINYQAELLYEMIEKLPYSKYNINIRVKQGSNVIEKYPLIIDLYDIRRYRVRSNELGGTWVIQRSYTKERKPVTYENLFQFDPELMRDIITFTQVAELFNTKPDREEINTYKNIYFERVESVLKEKYEALLLTQKGKVASFKEFIQTLKSYDTTPLDDYPINEVLEDIIEEKLNQRADA